MTRDEWIDRFAERLGVDPPSADTIEILLELAGTAAHASERTAAPVACYLTALAGRAPADAAKLAAEIEP